MKKLKNLKIIDQIKPIRIVMLGLALTLAATANAKKTQEQKVAEAERIPGCSDVVKQCVTQGFEPGDHLKTGKGLWVDCVGAVSKGKAVSGVTFTKDQAVTCRDAFRKLHPKKVK